MPHEQLSDGEVELLIDGLTDDVAIVWAMIHLGVRSNPPADPGPPTTDDVERTFSALRHLSAAGMVRIGRMEYDDGGPPGRLAPIHHVEEPLETVKARVVDACRGSEIDWEWTAWILNTEAGDNAARHALGSREEDDR